MHNARNWVFPNSSMKYYYCYIIPLRKCSMESNRIFCWKSISNRIFCWKKTSILLDILYDTKVSIGSNGIFCWIFLPKKYSIGYSVWHQSVNRIFFWIFYSIMFLLPTEYYVRFSIWHIRIPIEYSIEHPIEYSISWNSVIYDVIVDIQYDIRNSILKILLLFQNTHHYTSAFNWG